MISVIDILVVAFLIYEFLKLIKGTRAIPMLVAVVLIVGAFWIAHIEQLRTVDWLITTLFPLRRLRADRRLRRRNTSRAGAPGTSTVARARSGVFSPGDSYEDIVLAADHFSKTATGALIIIEREIGLRTFIESGVPLDANLSYDLLITIFRPSAPLHDGAVIVQKGRIAAAACFLPLSMNPVLSTQYGTRHRAAIGITEETDAVSVVVSEETGSISLAVGGAIERDITVEYLRERLSEVLRRYVPTATLPTTVTDRELSADVRDIETPGPRSRSGRRSGALNHGQLLSQIRAEEPALQAGIAGDCDPAVVGGGSRSAHRSSPDHTAGISECAVEPGDQFELSVRSARNAARARPPDAGVSVLRRSMPCSICRGQCRAKGRLISRAVKSGCRAM